MLKIQKIEIILFIFINILNLHLVLGHGRLLDPPSRSALWRFPEFKDQNHPINYNDNELFCGGFENQHKKNEGKCGICGDDWSQLQPRDHEGGGKYGRGIITRHYKNGQIIPLKIDLTTAHKGFFQFRLCSHNSLLTPTNQECLDKNVLELADGSGNKLWVDKGTGIYESHLVLPKGLTCSQCVFQWWYHTGNNWGKCTNGTSGLGCGPQETFVNCADITIA